MHIQMGVDAVTPMFLIGASLAAYSYWILVVISSLALGAWLANRGSRKLWTEAGRVVAFIKRGENDWTEIKVYVRGPYTLEMPAVGGGTRRIQARRIERLGFGPFMSTPTRVYRLTLEDGSTMDLAIATNMARPVMRELLRGDSPAP